MTGQDGILKWLRAVGEPTRLRLLYLCADAALSVSDLAEVLGQSEPRVSRHLKILCESGLLERLPQGQWVHYRVAQESAPLSFVRGLLGQLDGRDPQLQRDRATLHAATAGSAADRPRGAESRLGRTLASFLAAQRPALAPGSVLVIGASHPELLEAAAHGARRCTALVPSRRAAQACRAYAQRRGFRCQVLQAPRPQALGAAEFARAGAPFDTLLLDYPLSGTALPLLLAEARAALAPGGRLCLFEPYESLEGGRERVVEHPLARLRRLLQGVGLNCERLSPLEADGEHVLAAVAAAPASRGAMSGGQ
jgi:DNA-binding transcriptional ArsR family regulator